MAIGTATALIAGALIGTVGGVVAAQANKPKIPDAPQKPDTISPDKMATMASDREERARKKALGAYGRSDTILTNPNGLQDGNMLGGTQQANEQAIGKTLLGQ